MPAPPLAALPVAIAWRAATASPAACMARVACMARAACRMRPRTSPVTCCLSSCLGALPSLSVLAFLLPPTFDTRLLVACVVATLRALGMQAQNTRSEREAGGTGSRSPVATRRATLATSRRSSSSRARRTRRGRTASRALSLRRWSRTSMVTMSSCTSGLVAVTYWSTASPPRRNPSSARCPSARRTCSNACGCSWPARDTLNLTPPVRER